MTLKKKNCKNYLLLASGDAEATGHGQGRLFLKSVLQKNKTVNMLSSSKHTQ